MLRTTTIVATAAVMLLVASGSRADSLWDVARLSKAPEAVWGERHGLVQEVTFRAEPYRGKPSRVFAYYARPEGPGPFPAMVLLHGGGGRAFEKWAAYWAERGYAAIAPDLTGHYPQGQYPDAGPDPNEATFTPFEESGAREMWTYHAVADAILAHSLLASRPEVDRRRIGITGISWGGYLTCIVAGVDHRFRVAVPVYGCGFLHENSAWKESVLDKMAPDLRERWVRLFDPSRYLAGVRCPILFLNGTNDHAYPLDSHRKSTALVTAPVTLSIQIGLPHGHIWTFGIVDAFIDSHLRGGVKLPTLSKMRIDGRSATTVVGAGEIRSAELVYTEDPGRWGDRKWKTQPAKIEGRRIVAELPENGWTACFFSVTDLKGNVVTTPYETPAR